MQGFPGLSDAEGLHTVAVGKGHVWNRRVRKWLNRRSQRGRTSWERIAAVLLRDPLPAAWLPHSVIDLLDRSILPLTSPCAGNRLARICGGVER
jgi:hypothetical protein